MVEMSLGRAATSDAGALPAPAEVPPAEAEQPASTEVRVIAAAQASRRARRGDSLVIGVFLTVGDRAGGLVGIAEGEERGPLGGAAGFRQRAAGGERTAGRGVEGTGVLAA